MVAAMCMQVVNNNYRLKFKAMKFVQLIILASSLGLSIQSIGQDQGSKASSKPYTLRLVPQIHSTGYFPYGGSYLTYHPTMDAQIFFQKGNTGVFVFKSVDLVDHSVNTNYASIGIVHTIKLSESLEFIPFAGYFLAQVESFKDQSSDAWAAVDLKKRVNKNLVLVNTSMMGNIAQRAHSLSMTNRLKLNYTLRSFTVDMFVWYSQAIDQQRGYTSASLGITAPSIAINPSVKLKFHSAYQQYISQEHPGSAMKRGVLISMSAPIDLSRK
ncbi:MAG: hypothetical protein AB7O48_19430 [Cyclobacteriaceae bacterium]